MISCDILGLLEQTKWNRHSIFVVGSWFLVSLPHCYSAPRPSLAISLTVGDDSSKLQNSRPLSLIDGERGVNKSGRVANDTPGWARIFKHFEMTSSTVLNCSHRGICPESRGGKKSQRALFSCSKTTTAEGGSETRFFAKTILFSTKLRVWLR